MGYSATDKIFENMLKLKRFGLYFELIMNRKCAFKLTCQHITFTTNKYNVSHIPVLLTD